MVCFKLSQNFPRYEVAGLVTPNSAIDVGMASRSAPAGDRAGRRLPIRPICPGRGDLWKCRRSGSPCCPLSAPWQAHQDFNFTARARDSPYPLATPS